MQYAAIYRTKEKLIICSRAQTVIGLGLSNEPYIHLSRTSGNSEIVAAINKVLSLNQYNIPHPKQNEWGTINKKFLEGLGFKSNSTLHNNASYCSIARDKETLTFCPSRNEGAKGGFTFFNGGDIVINCISSDDEIVSALNEVLKISEKNYGLLKYQ